MYELFCATLPNSVLCVSIPPHPRLVYPTLLYSVWSYSSYSALPRAALTFLILQHPALLRPALSYSILHLSTELHVPYTALFYSYLTLLYPTPTHSTARCRALPERPSPSHRNIRAPARNHGPLFGSASRPPFRSRPDRHV